MASQHPSRALLALSLIMATITSISAVPQIEAGTNQGKDYITVIAADLILQTPTAPKISLLQVAQDLADVEASTPSTKDLQDAVQTMRNVTQALNQSTPDRFEMTTSIDAAVAGGVSKAFAADQALIASLNAKLDNLATTLSGFGETKLTVSKLAQDVEYLLEHAVNVTKCANDSQVHVGEGTCVSPVPTCPNPSAPDGGAVAVSSPYVIPGVTAEYSCTKDDYFVSGTTVRVCNESRAFYPAAEPKCLQCKVVSCAKCVKDQQTCGKCLPGFDLSSDASKCVERKDTLVVFSGSPPGSRHNWREAQQLEANTDSWKRFYPTPPFSVTGYAGGIIEGDSYLVAKIAVKLSRGGSSWDTVATPLSFSKLPFFATVKGVGTNQDGLYIFGTEGSQVYKPKENKWKRLPLHSDKGGDQTLRSNGATAVVDNLIYCLGGLSKGGLSDRVDIFDTTKGVWQEGVKMTFPRRGHAAAEYAGKIYVFGGEKANGIYLKTVEVWNPTEKKWTTLTNMKEAWSEMTTGPLPVFADGSVMIPHAYRRGNIRTSQVYNVKDNSWKDGVAPVLMGGRYVTAMGSFEN